MTKHILSILVVVTLMNILTLPLHAQYDDKLLFGYSLDIENKWGNSVINFSDDQVELKVYSDQNSISIDDQGSYVCDKYGDIVLMTNGCRVYDKDYNVISGTDPLNPGWTDDLYCDSTENGNSNSNGAYEGHLFVPDLVDDNVYYLLHEDLEITAANDDIFSPNIYMSTFRDTGDDIILVSKEIILTGMFSSGHFNAVPNADKTGWWTLVREYGSNKIISIEILSDSLNIKEAQTIGAELWGRDMGSAQTAFSPTGEKYGLNTMSYGIMLYDFDNATGTFSNYQEIPYPNMEIVTRGICFSQSGRFIYCGSGDFLYQIDLDNGEIVELAEYREPSPTGWPISIGKLEMGPDCRIYVSPGTATNYFHVINHPEEKGEACGLELKIEAPTRISHNWPNIAQYRGISPCDPAIAPLMTSSSVETEAIEQEILIYPNPASDMVYLRGELGSELSIYNSSGMLVEQMTIARNQKEITIDLQAYPIGIYGIRVKGEVYKVIKM